ncbi:MAG: prephenate dehydratase [Clostridiales bacterium]|nr:prephenate dehydratase [Clostridiales bacterium]
MKYGYLGPRGTFSHTAADFFAQNEETVPFPSIYAVLSALSEGSVDFAVVPIENSTEGSVNASVDSLIFDFDFSLKAQLNLPITENLAVKPETKFEDITKVISHPQPIAQCSRYLRNNLPEVPTETVSSTAAAMQIVAETNKPLAAIGGAKAAELYGLKVIREHIQDNDSNFTQFALVSRDTSHPTEYKERITIAFSVFNEPGTLLRILTVLSMFDLNMIKILSRPMRNRPEEYVFYIDLENADKKDIDDAFTMIKRKASFFKFLGTYDIYDLRKH